MLIWSRWGILAILIPAVLLGVCRYVSTTITKDVIEFNEEPPRRTKTPPVPDDELTEEQIAEREAAAKEQIVKELQAAENRTRQIKRWGDLGMAIGMLLGSMILWPLGTWMNKSETRMLIDAETKQMIEAQFGGGHTFFFIPMQYWSIVWVIAGVVKLFGSFV